MQIKNQQSKNKQTQRRNDLDKLERRSGFDLGRQF